MSKPYNNEFLKNLLLTLDEFHKFQIDHMEGDDRPPYDYNTLGLYEWLLFNKGIDCTEPTELKKERE